MTVCLDDNQASAFVAGDLAPPAAARVEAHLAGCRDCRALVAALAASLADGDADSEVATTPRAAPRGKPGRGGAAGGSTTLPAPGSDRAADTGARTAGAARTAEPVVAAGDHIGRYLVLGRLGAGGMGVVFTAYDPQLDRKVALKLLRTGPAAGDPAARARLVREAQAIAQLSHPNVVAVYDVGTAASGEVYLAMELVEGETLTAWLGQWDRTWRDILEPFGQAGRGLMAAHARGLVHRDFKPDNVLVGVDGRVRVTDFGLARSLLDQLEPASPAAPRPELAALRASLTATGAVLGTPRYMAPEQLRGLDADARSDQFSFCVALYEALYHRHPLPGDSAVDALHEGLPAQPPPDDARVPASVGRAVMRGLSLDPAARFSTMAGLLAALVPAPPHSTRRRAAAIAGGVALALGGAAAALVAQDRGRGGLERDLDRLEARLRETVAERDALSRRLERVLAEQDDLRARTQEVRALQRELAAKDEQIQQLQDELGRAPDAGLAVAGPATPPPRAAPDAAPPDAAPPGLSELALAEVVATRLGAVESCMREFAEREAVIDASFVVALDVGPDGRVVRQATRGLDDTVTPLCVGNGLSRARFPASEVVTSAEVTVVLAAGEVRLVTRRTGTTAPGATIDL